MTISEVRPTVLLRRTPHGGFEQCVSVKLCNHGPEGCSAALTVRAGGEVSEQLLGDVPPGESSHEVFVPAIEQPGAVEFALLVGDAQADLRVIPWQPPRRLTVHVIQRSHHDVGYTNLASTVLREYDGFLDQVIDMAEHTRGFPEESQFRMAVEQAWSIDHFLRHARPERAAKMIALMQSGRVELTALFGNMVTEICGHESLIRALYHARRLARLHGISITTAEHNDVPGMSWGLCQVLTDAGIKLFCPMLPRYYNWGEKKMRSFWDDETLFSAYGQPGAFWWEAPSGKRLLLLDNAGAWGDMNGSLPGLADKLTELVVKGYPYDTVRWPVIGGARDNSPYIEGYAHSIKAWNEKWAWPRLICSTNARFYADFAPELPGDLPVFRGELPGQDYPTGSTSTAADTAVSRNTHVSLMTAERLAATAASATGYPYQAEQLFAAYEDILWYDEHTWGHHFPCGPTMRASRLEKTVHAHRAQALAHDVTSKALAAIADRVPLGGEGFHLVVYNPLPETRTGVISAPLREIDNCGSVMVESPAGDDPAAGTYLRGVLLNDRWHANPPQEIVDGHFELIDVATGEVVPYQIARITSADDTVPDAPERAGLGQGGYRYGMFELPNGIQRDLRFIAKDVPACGYRTYRLAPAEASPLPPSPPSGEGDVAAAGGRGGEVPLARGEGGRGARCLENAFYRLTIAPDLGRVVSIWDKELDRELLDPAAPHRFGDLVVRSPHSAEGEALPAMTVEAGPEGPVSASFDFWGGMPGHPAVRQTVTLYPDVRRIDFATRILKDPTPLLDAHLAFPFAFDNPRFRYEGVLSVMEPIADYLPGAYSDSIAVQNWVSISDGDMTVLWSSLDAPMASLGGLWPGYVSPAHSCFIAERADHPPLTADSPIMGSIYSTLFYNNFGTNFYVSQTGSVLFRYSISTRAGSVSDAEAVRFGLDATTPFEQLFTERPREAALPPSRGFLSLTGDPVVLLTCKRAEDGDGWVVRLWNPSPNAVKARVEIGFTGVSQARLTGIAEDGDGASLECSDGGFDIEIAACATATVRMNQ